MLTAEADMCSSKSLSQAVGGTWALCAPHRGATTVGAEVAVHAAVEPLPVAVPEPPAGRWADGDQIDWHRRRRKAVNDHHTVFTGGLQHLNTGLPGRSPTPALTGAFDTARPSATTNANARRGTPNAPRRQTTRTRWGGLGSKTRRLAKVATPSENVRHWAFLE